MKRGIRRRLVGSYLLLTIFTVILFETIILSAFMIYYKESIKQTLRDQASMFSSYYEQEILEGRFEKEADQLLSQYNFLVSVHVQLIDDKGLILAESHPSHVKSVYQEEDVQQGLNGKFGSASHISNGEKVMSVTYPLQSNGEIAGAVRLTTSLAPLYAVFMENSVMLILIGGIVIATAALISFFLAGSITKPISQMIEGAEQMASGEYSVRIPEGKKDELGRLAGTLNYMAGQVEEHERLKNEFIASISHDLRTPLTSITGWAITLHSIAEDPHNREGLDIIKNESERLSHLLLDLLDYSSLSSGRLSFNFERLDLVKVVQRVVQQLKQRADRQGIMFTMECSESAITVQADENRIIQLLINILDNALNFSLPEDSILVRLTSDEHNACIQITDTGAGIPEHQLATIKEKFIKGETGQSGTGLGLAICEEIIRGHEGDLDIQSSPGKGTTVRISLPVTIL